MNPQHPGRPSGYDPDDGLGFSQHDGLAEQRLESVSRKVLPSLSGAVFEKLGIRGQPIQRNVAETSEKENICATKRKTFNIFS